MAGCESHVNRLSSARRQEREQEQRERDPEPSNLDKVPVEDVGLGGEVAGRGGGRLVGLVEGGVGGEVLWRHDVRREGGEEGAED